MNKLGNLLIFVLGAGLGSGATYFILRDRFESEIETREQQLKAAYDIKYAKVEKEEPKAETPVKSREEQAKEMLAKKKSITDYSNIVKKLEYEKEEKEEMLIDNEIIIEPDNRDDVIGFGLEPYETVFATIYADGYLVDSNDNIIDIYEMIGGKETLEHFGEGDDPDLLHVRNVLYEIDYEIDRDDRTYAEVSGKNPAELPELDY